MKKVLALILSVLLLCSLVACGGSSTAKDEEEATPAETTPSNETADNSSKNAEKSEDEKNEDSDDNDSQKPAEEPEEAVPVIDEGVFSATIEETTLVDEQSVLIVAKKLECSDYSATLTVYMENNSDKTLKFRSWGQYINDYMMEYYLNEEIEPGMAANKKINYDIDELRMFGITDIAKIGIGFELEDDDYDQYLLSDMKEIPTSVFASYDSGKDSFENGIGSILPEYHATLIKSTDNVMGEVKGISFGKSYVIKNSDNSETTLLEISNKSGQDIYFAMSNITIDGITLSHGTWDSTAIASDKKAVMAINMEYLFDDYAAVLDFSTYGTVSFEGSVRSIDEYEELTANQVDIVFSNEGTNIQLPDAIFSEDGISVYFLGIAEDSFEYSDDIHAIFMIANETDAEIVIDLGSNSLYVNKLKTSELTYSRGIPAKGKGILDIEMMESSLEENDLTIDTIESVSFTMEVRDSHYSKIMTPVITISTAG